MPAQSNRPLNYIFELHNAADEPIHHRAVTFTIWILVRRRKKSFSMLLESALCCDEDHWRCESCVLFRRLIFFLGQPRFSTPLVIGQQ